MLRASAGMLLLVCQPLAAQSPAIAAVADPWRAYYQELRSYHEKLRHYHQELAAWKSRQGMASLPTPGAPRPVMQAIPLIQMIGGQAACSRQLPVQVQYAVLAANHLQSSPYIRGGGHRQLEDAAYDCSSATSYVLIKAGLLDRVLTSAQLASYGQPGAGRFITLWVKPGSHVFLTLCGLRLDTSGGSAAEGPRWRTGPRSYAGFFPRHPPGF